MDKRRTLIAVIVAFFLITATIWATGRNYKTPSVPGEYQVHRNAPLKNGDAVRAAGQIKRVNVTKTGMMFINMETKDGLQLTVVSFPAMGKLPFLRRGETLEVRGVVDHYRNTLQILPYSRQEIRTKNSKKRDRSEIMGGQDRQWI